MCSARRRTATKRQDRDAGGRFGKDVHVIVLSWRLSSVHASLDARFERLELRITENVALDESADQLVD